MHLNLGEVIKMYSLQYRQKMKLEQTGEGGNCPIRLKEEVSFVLQEIAYDTTIETICENLVYPILKESWKSFSNMLSLWGHISIEDKERSAILFDYLFTKRSEFGKIMIEPPYLMMVEVVKDAPKTQSGAALAKMYALQQMNSDLSLTIYTILTNGEIWEFSKLEQNVFTQYIERFDIGDLDRLFGGVSNFFGLANKQIIEGNIVPLDIHSKRKENNG